MLALSPDGDRLHVTARGSTTAPGSTISTIDTTTLHIVATTPVTPTPTDVAPSPDGHTLWVTSTGRDNGGPGTLSQVDTATNTVLATVPVGSDADRLVISPTDGGSTSPRTATTPSPSSTPHTCG